ncbi:MAG: acyltransferase [Chlorobi bacterium]|nr:acyltransferase [Chlorobiota bacterium]
MRYRWLDYLRGLAALWMIEVHVVDVALDPHWHTSQWFPWLSLTHGFVAVAFLFCAGGALAITLERKLDAYRRFERPLWDYLAKLGLLLLIGYWLHLPAFSLERTLHATPQELVRLADCDILQTIAYSSLIALAIALFIPRPNWYRSTYAAISITIAILTPLVWEHRFDENLPLFIGALIAPQPVSKFPLFPFAAYFFAGAWIVLWLQNRPRRVIWLVTLACLGIAAVTMVIGFSSPKQWWHSSPIHTLFRLSATVAALCMLMLTHETITRQRFSNILLLAGQQSLWVYVFHLLLVYGSVGGNGLSAVIGKQLNPFETVMLIIAISVVTLGTAWMWAYLKHVMPQVVRVVVAAVVVTAGATFVLLPARYAALLSTGELVRRDGVVPAVVQSDLPRSPAVPVQE